MADSPIRRLIEESSLGTPEARALRGSVPDDVARRIVERSKQIGAVRVNPRLAMIGGVPFDASPPTLADQGASMDADGTIRDSDGNPLIRITTLPD